MDSRREVFQTTGVVLAGEVILCGIMIGIFALAGKLDATVWLGAGTGLALAVGNFFIMAMNADVAADRAVQQDVAGGRKIMTGSYIARLIVIFGILFLLVKSGRCHPVASIVPLALTRWILTGYEFFSRKGGA